MLGASTESSNSLVSILSNITAIVDGLTLVTSNFTSDFLLITLIFKYFSPAEVTFSTTAEATRSSAERLPMLERLP